MAAAGELVNLSLLFGVFGRSGAKQFRHVLFSLPVRRFDHKLMCTAFEERSTRNRLNALSHGLRSEEILLRGEDEEALRELGERLRNELQPAGELENLLVERIIASYWRLRRVGRVEAGIFAWKRSEELAERAEREA
jgi:hypothetical protein